MIYNMQSSILQEPMVLIIGGAVIFACILGIVAILTPRKPDLEMIYRNMIYDHFERLGFKKETCKLLYAANQQTIDKFLQLTEIMDNDSIKKY